MNKLMLAAVAAVSFAFGGCDPKEKKHYGTYNSVVYAQDGDVVPGEWTCQYTKARAYAVRHKRPFIFFWGNAGCGVCNAAEKSIGQADFVAWQKKYGAVMAFTVNNAVGGGEAAKMKSALGSVPNYPGVGFYWPKSGIDEKSYDAKIYGPMTGKDLALKAEEVFK